MRCRGNHSGRRCQAPEPGRRRDRSRFPKARGPDTRVHGALGSPPITPGQPVWRPRSADETQRPRGRSARGWSWRGNRLSAADGEGSEAPGHMPGSRSARAFSSTGKSSPGGGLSWSPVPALAPWLGGTRASEHSGFLGPRWVSRRQAQRSGLPDLSCPPRPRNIAHVPHTIGAGRKPGLPLPGLAGLNWLCSSAKWELGVPQTSVPV